MCCAVLRLEAEAEGAWSAEAVARIGQQKAVEGAIDCREVDSRLRFTAPARRAWHTMLRYPDQWLSATWTVRSAQGWLCDAMQEYKDHVGVQGPRGEYKDHVGVQGPGHD